jgi:hypothetical protein
MSTFSRTTARVLRKSQISAVILMGLLIFLVAFLRYECR